MALTARLEVRQTQQLVMTPQLQQAIRLLQYSNLELNAFVEAELERNPLLERVDEKAGGEAPEPLVAPELADGGDELPSGAELQATTISTSSRLRRRTSPSRTICVPSCPSP